MWAYLRRRFGRLDYQVPPQEPPGAAYISQPPPDAASVAAAIAGIDIRLRELTDIPAPMRTAMQWHEIDLLLDRRMRLTCPMVPVVPGRSS